MFDVVLFTGVLYHVQHPLEALKRVRSKTGELAILETHVNQSLGSALPLALTPAGHAGAQPPPPPPPGQAPLESIQPESG